MVIANAAGGDLPRGTALLGAVLDLPSVGVTDRPLLTVGAQPRGPWAGRRVHSGSRD